LNNQLAEFDELALDEIDEMLQPEPPTRNTNAVNTNDPRRNDGQEVSDFT